MAHAHGFVCDWCGAPAYATMYWDAWAGHYCLECATELLLVKPPKRIDVAAGAA